MTLNNMTNPVFDERGKVVAEVILRPLSYKVPNY